jgi:thiol-disulfide isomerase/thioredoxin
MKKPLLVLFIISLFVLISCSSAIKEATPEIQALSSCLRDSGALMYGAYWCPHCEEQREMFGTAVDDLPYIECTEQEARCAQAGIQGYPTWIFADGSRVSGTQTFGELAEMSGCVY